mgnify:CR=1 FL=1
MNIYLNHSFLLLLASISIALTGCADDLTTDPGNTDSASQLTIQSTDNGDGTTTTRIDASAEDTWVYFHLGGASEVTPTAPEDSPDWDLGFQRFKIKSNRCKLGTS